MGDSWPDDRVSTCEVEAMLRAAADYVQPTDDLRPRTLEAASEERTRRRSTRLLVAAAVLGFALPTAAAWAVREGFGSSRSPVSSAELHRRANELATLRGTNPGWGLFEAFCQLRQEQAKHFGTARRAED